MCASYFAGDGFLSCLVTDGFSYELLCFFAVVDAFCEQDHLVSVRGVAVLSKVRDACFHICANTTRFLNVSLLVVFSIRIYTTSVSTSV